MSGRMSRDKGKRGELEACADLAEACPGLKRTYHQSRSGWDAPDIDVEGCPLWWEVKRTERLNINKAMAQAVEACAKRGSDRIPAVYSKCNRGDGLVTVRARDLARLMRQRGDA